MYVPRDEKALAGYDPFRMMDKLEYSFFSDPFAYFRGSSLARFRTDVKDEGDAYVLQADLPGFEKKDIHLDMEGDVLTIRAERHSQHEDKDEQGKYLCRERSYGSYQRSFDMFGIQSENIKARYDNGVLTLTMPKKEAEGPASRRLEIE